MVSDGTGELAVGGVGVEEEGRRRLGGGAGRSFVKSSLVVVVLELFVGE